MSLPHALQYVKERPGMYLRAVEYNVAVAFVGGFDLANNGGLLIGLHEWLAVKVGWGGNLGWSALILHDFNSNGKTNEGPPNSGDDERQAVDYLFRTLDSFLEARDSPNGLRTIMAKYERWLRSQSWYSKSSPEWIQTEDTNDENHM